MMIEESIAQSILHQQKDVIAKRLKEIQEAMREGYAKEDLIVQQEGLPFSGESGIAVRLRYDKSCRSWSLYSGVETNKEDWRDWVGHGFLYYEECNLDELAHELTENTITNAVEEYYDEYC